LSSLSASTTYYYNISSCDIDSNCNISEQETFTTSAATSQDNPSSGGSSGGGGGGGSSASTTPSIIIPITEPIKQRLPELNLVETEKGQILDYEGGRHIIKLSENIEHIFEINKISEEEASFTLYSEPISFTLKKGESKKIDINSDKISDIQFKLNEIYNRNKVDVQITKLLGANLLPENKEILDHISNFFETEEKILENKSYMYIVQEAVPPTKPIDINEISIIFIVAILATIGGIIVAIMQK